MTLPYWLNFHAASTVYKGVRLVYANTRARNPCRAATTRGRFLLFCHVVSITSLNHGPLSEPNISLLYINAAPESDGGTKQLFLNMTDDVTDLISGVT